MKNAIIATSLHAAVLLAAVSLAAVGCGASRTVYVVERHARGGELRVQGAYMERAAQAQIVMAERCGGPFGVVAERDGRTVLLRAPEPNQRRFRFVCVDRAPGPLAME